MDAGLLAIAASNSGLITTEDVAKAGLTRACVRWAGENGKLVRLAVGVWSPRDGWEQLDPRAQHLMKVRAGQHRRPGAVACAESAAVIHGLPLPGDPPDEPRMLAARDPSRRGGDGYKGGGLGRRAWLGDDEVERPEDGVRVTTPARTVVDLARHLPFPWSLAAADAARRFLGTTTSALSQAADRNPNAPGHPAAVLVAKHADGAAESALESVARGVMIQLALPLPRLQVELGRGWALYRADLLVAEHWTVIEADGKVKYADDDSTAPGRVWQDKRRRDDLHDWGYEVVRFVMADLNDTRAWGRRCLRSFERAYERRGLPIPEWPPLLPARRRVR